MDGNHGPPAPPGAASARPGPDAAGLIAAIDWGTHPLGPRAQWPRSLETAVTILLKCRLPMYIAWGPDHVQFYNDAYAPILGHKHPSSMGGSARVTWAEIWTTVWPMWESVLRGESIGYRDFAVAIERYGRLETCHFDFSYSALPDDTGGVGGILVTFVETTERVALEWSLRDKAAALQRLAEQGHVREKQLQAVLDSVPAAVISVDERFDVVLFNRAAERMFRVDAGEVIGRTVDALLPERYRPGHQQKMRGFAEGAAGEGVHGVERELTGRRWDGDEFPVEAALAKVRVDGGLLMTIALRDASETHELRRERVARAAAEAASQAKSQFLSHLSHELRTPLNSVIGFGQLLELSGGGDPAATQRYATRILDAGRHLLHMVEDLLDLSRIEHNEMSLQRVPVDLPEVVRLSIDLVLPRAQTLQVVVDSAQVDPAHGRVSGDPLRMQQVVTNLLANAVKYNRSGGRVDVSTEAVDDHVLLHVRDTGPGLAAEQVAQLFRPFERLGQDHGPIEGAGLGLTISRQLARAMGGDITVQSTPGEGSIFTLQLAAHRDVTSA